MGKREDDWRFASDRLDRLRESRWPNLSEEFFEEYVADCWRRGFDPASSYLRVAVFPDEETGLPRLRMALTLEGQRVEAHGTKEYAGCDDVTFDPPDANPPTKATVTVYRFTNGQRCAFTASALWRECAQQPLSDFWERRPWMALGYRARMAALREAFPDRFGGLWAPEELERAADPAPPKSRGTSNLAGVSLAPTTQIEVEGEMTAMGYMDPEHREGVLDRLRETFADLRRADPKMFWGTALAALKRNPGEFGPLPRKIG